MSRFSTPNNHAVLMLRFVAVFLIALMLGSIAIRATPSSTDAATVQMDTVTVEIAPLLGQKIPVSSLSSVATLLPKETLSEESSSKLTRVEAATLSAVYDNLKAAKKAALAKSFVPMEKWHCGASDIDRSLSHQLAEADCPARMYEANLCCLAHDLCYAEEGKTQDECDSAFCFCLERTVAEVARQRNETVGGCTSFSDSHCFLVQLFGAAAHLNAKASRSTTTSTTTVSTTASITTVVPSTTTTHSTITTTVTTPIETKSPQSPAEIAQFITHNVSVQCFDYHLSSCVEEMHACVTAHNVENKKLLDQPRLHRLSQRIQQSIRAEAAADAAAACATQFCACTSAAQTLSKDVAHTTETNCGESVALMCHEFGGEIDTIFKANKQDAMLNIHFWSVSVQYFGRDMDLATTVLGGFCALATFFIFGYLLMKAFGRRCGHGGNAELFTVARPSDFIIGACQRRQKRDSKAGYNAFTDKKASASSTDSGYHNHKHGANGNNSSCGKILKSTQLLHSQQHMIPLNSSKAQLIMPDENSSASSPSINSNE